MQTRQKLVWTSLILIIGFSLILGGCSQLNKEENETGSDLSFSSTPSSPDEVPIPPFDLTHYQYPEKANYAPEGYQLIPLSVSTPERATMDDDWACGLIFYWWGGDVFLDDNETMGIDVGSYGIPYFVKWIAVTRPEETEPWIEFEPHGLVFNYSQTARVSWADCGLPPGVEPEDVTVWYWNEELNEYEYIGGTVYPEDQYIEYDIDHFSRYVIANAN